MDCEQRDVSMVSLGFQLKVCSLRYRCWFCLFQVYFLWQTPRFRHFYVISYFLWPGPWFMCNHNYFRRLLNDFHETRCEHHAIGAVLILPAWPPFALAMSSSACRSVQEVYVGAEVLHVTASWEMLRISSNVWRPYKIFWCAENWFVLTLRWNLNGLVLLQETRLVRGFAHRGFAYSRKNYLCIAA
jgi:hypothetical protein